MNQILASLPVTELHRLNAELSLVSLEPRDVLRKQGEPVQNVYFPCSGLCSISRQTDRGHSIEVASVGREGIVGISALFGVPTEDETEARVLIGGSAYCMSAGALERALTQRGPLCNAVCQYAAHFISDLMTTVVCNALHPVEQRLARWLLQASDRAATNEIPLTHDALAAVLGVQRASITVAVLNLKQTGAFESRRQHFRISDRNALVVAACCCAKTAAFRSATA